MRKNYLILFFCLLQTNCYSVSAQALPKTFIHDYGQFQKIKSQIQNGNRVLLDAKKKLLNDANKILDNNRVYSVTFKKQLPPSGIKNDFYSLSRYWWPNNNSTGLPYINIDGRINPEVNDVRDAEMLYNVSMDVYLLGLAYYYTGNESYAQKARTLIKVFFFQPSTKMNPNLRYSQMIKGKSNSGGATISSSSFIFLIEGVQLLSNSKSLSRYDQVLLKDWFNKFLTWMLNSEQGKRERQSNNNIGTYFTVQTAVYSLFVGKIDMARTILGSEGPTRISNQIAANGEMTLELSRAEPWEYVKYNLTALEYLAQLASRVGLDLVDYEGPNGGSIKKAFNWLIPFASEQRQWTYGKSKVTSRQIKIVLGRSSILDVKTKSLFKYELPYINLLTTID